MNRGQGTTIDLFPPTGAPDAAPLGDASMGARRIGAMSELRRGVRSLPTARPVALRAARGSHASDGAHHAARPSSRRSRPQRGGPLRNRATVRAPQLLGRAAECDTLDELVTAVRTGSSRALVLRGEAGAGKSALLDYTAGRAADCLVLRAAGVESEMGLAFAGLHQLLAPMLDRLGRLPDPQRDALRTAFGVAPGPAPDRFVLALAVLGVLSEIAEERPLLCLVDDEQWLDRASAQALTFVARRLGAESVGLVFATRMSGDDVAGLAELVVEGLSDAAARALLDSVSPGPLDPRVRDRIVGETRGNPLALLELPRSGARAAPAGGFGLPAAASLSGSIEDSFRRQLEALPPQARSLIALAAADPLGDLALLWRAADRLGIAPDAATAAAESGLIEFCSPVRFRHPLARSAAYYSAPLRDRQVLHGALAGATDPELDPDRRAWHRAEAAPGPDEAVAIELERSAGRARARGGLAAAAGFLERAAMLTADAGRRSQRLIAAAALTCDAGALDAALGLLTAVEAGRLDPLQAAEVERLRGQIAFDQGRTTDAARLLLSAAERFEPLDASLARETHMASLMAAIRADGAGGSVRLLEAAAAARGAPAAPQPPRAVDLLLDALALRATDGYAASALALERALAPLRARHVGAADFGAWLWLAGSLVALEVWDYDAWHTLAARQAAFARQSGALVHMQLAVGQLACTHILAGEFDAAALLIEDDRLIADATGGPAIACGAMLLAAWRGDEHRALDLIDSTLREAAKDGMGRIASYATYASAVLYNGLGRHDAARDAAREVFERDPVGFGPLVLAELAEAASRTDDAALLADASDALAERARLTPTDWALGMAARADALLAHGESAERLHRESIKRLGRTRVDVELARAHLLFGEWLRRERRRVDAREELRVAHEMFTAMGADAFAERAQRELSATGATARKRTVDTRDELTPQEAQIARLACEGLSNPEIGTRLFISPRTVKYHLRKVFSKLDISSRGQLSQVFSARSTTAQVF